MTTWTNQLTNPLRNARADLGHTPADAYTEVTPYGPRGSTDANPAGDGTVSTQVRWVVDAGADQQAAGDYSSVRAVWDGSLYVAQDQTPTLPVDQKLVTLALVFGGPSYPTLYQRLSDAGLGPVPRVAFYRNIAWSGLDAILTPLAKNREALVRFEEDLGAPVPSHSLLVPAGSVIGKLGQITLDDGTTGLALDFALAVSTDGSGPVYPDAFYGRVAQGQGSGVFLHSADERGGLSVWAVGAPRSIVWLRDEWHRPLGETRGATATFTPSGAGPVTVRYDVRPAPVPESALAFSGAWPGLAAPVSAAMTATNGDTLLLSQVSMFDPAAETLPLTMSAPGELLVQAIDPLDWFPAPGGTGWTGTVTGGSATVIQPVAPHLVARYSNGNQITPLIDGAAYFADLEDEMAAMTDPSDYFCQTGWWLDPNFVLQQTSSYGESDPPYEPTGRKLIDLLTNIGQAGGSMYLLIWDQLADAVNVMLPAVPDADRAVRAVWEKLNDSGATATGVQQFWERVAFPTVLDKSTYDPNDDAVKAVNGLTGSGRHQAILDSRLRPAASHHAKSVIVKNGAGLAAYVGGIDVHLNRTNSASHIDHAPGEFYHDVQCKIEGPAARDVLRTFISRWNDHPLSDSTDDPYNGKTADMQCLDLGFLSPGHSVPLDSSDDRQGGTCLAQIARTFGNCSGMVGVDRPHGNRFRTNDGYAFAPQGEFGIEAAVLTAIKRARRFIYIEDQYLGNLKVATAVADKIKEHKDRGERFFVYIVTPDMPKYSVDVVQGLLNLQAVQVVYRTISAVAPVTAALVGAVLEAALEANAPIDHVVFEQPWAYTQNRWQDILGSVDPDHKYWQMFCLRLPSFDRVVPSPFGTVARKLGFMSTVAPIEDRRIYVHTKTVIVDDVWAMIGSANMNVRSYTMDTEITCGFIDGAVDDRGRRVAVRQYRQQLWAEHLGMRITDPALDLDPEDPKMTDRWTGCKDDLDPAGYSVGFQPHGARIYVWPRRDAVAANVPPVVTWYKDDEDHLVNVLGVTQLPQYWWVVEEYGKAAWAADCSMLRPPAIGSADPRFAFDGQTGEAYKAFDLKLHSDCSN